MKKWMSILVTVVMLCGLLAGCGSSDGKKSDTAAETEGNTAEAVADSDIKVGFIFIGDENDGYTLSLIHISEPTRP